MPAKKVKDYNQFFKCTREDHAKWHEEAKSRKMTFTDFVTNLLNRACGGDWEGPTRARRGEGPAENKTCAVLGHMKLRKPNGEWECSRCGKDLQ